MPRTVCGRRFAVGDLDLGRLGRPAAAYAAMHVHGATAQEAAEAIGVAILMNGGPGTVYGPRAYAAVREFFTDPHLAPQPAGAHTHEF